MIKLQIAGCCTECPRFSVQQTTITLSRTKSDTYLTCSDCYDCEILDKFEEENNKNNE